MDNLPAWAGGADYADSLEPGTHSRCEYTDDFARAQLDERALSLEVSSPYRYRGSGNSV